MLNQLLDPARLVCLTYRWRVPTNELAVVVIGTVFLIINARGSAQIVSRRNVDGTAKKWPVKKGVFGTRGEW